MRDPIADDIKGLATLGLDDLRTVWRRHFGPPPTLRSAPLLRLMLAWRLQAAVSGGLDPEAKRRLARSGPVQAEGLDLGPGTVLRREWQGAIVEVHVEAEGFRWQGALYPSLSAVAKAITGTRWNGPRFFGLRRSATP